MAQHPELPKFGNWESEEDVPYTVYFDNPRKDKKSGKTNPNIPQGSINNKTMSQKVVEAGSSKHEYHTRREDGEPRTLNDSPLHPDAVHQKSATDSGHQFHSDIPSGIGKSEVEVARVVDAPRQKHDRKLSREEGDMRRPGESPLRQDAGGRKATDSAHHRYGGLSAGDTPRRVTRQGVGSDRSIENSPLHPHSQSKFGGRGSGVSSPSWERKNTSEGSHGLGSSTPGRSRLRSVTRGDETPDHSLAIPKFGEWDESDPAAAEGYSHIFNRVREEKQSGLGNLPTGQNETPKATSQKQYGNEKPKGCWCFWSSKR